MQQNSTHNSNSKILTSYISGFLLSLIFTLIPYIIVTKHLFEISALITATIVFAVAQLFVQLYFFLHLGHESKPRWNLMAFLFTVVTVVTIVLGSLWIMNNLNYNMSKSQNIDSYIQDQENIHK